MNMTFEEPLSKKDIPEEKIEWGQWIEKEIYIPFFQEALGDVFDLAVKTSKEVDMEKGGPKIDIIARFKKDGSHLAIQGASIDLGNRGGEEILEEKKAERALWPIWKMEKISKDNELAYLPKDLAERVPKVVLNFEHLAIEEAQAFWASEGKNKRLFDYLNLDRDVKKEEERWRKKETNDYRTQIDILQQIMEELEATSEKNKNWKELIEPKIRILNQAISERWKKLGELTKK